MKLPSAARWVELGPHVDALLALAAPERMRRLDELAAADAPLAAELRGLMESLDSASHITFLDRAVEPPTSQPEAGDSVGSWALVEMIGEGGMGSVWRAKRTDGRFEGEAAIKLLKSGLFDAGAQERFRREGAILARLQHPGIARLLDAGILDSGRPYLVLEMVYGQAIDRWCHARRLSAKACVAQFERVLDAVSAAHAQLVIHRDLKPTNILVDDAGQVHLLDFGIARLQDDADAALTRDGSLALTPRYAAPEQFSGGTLSVATDVYALGVVLHELLTGAHPSGLPATASTLAYMQAAAAGEFKAASSHGPRRELRGDLDTVLAKALATRPEDRYATVTALHDDLRRYLRHEPIAARPASLAYRAQKLLRRRPFECAAVLAIVIALPTGAHVQAAVLLSMAVGTGAALWQARRANREAVLAKAEQQRAEAVKQFIASIFGQAVPRTGAGGVVTAGDLLQAAANRIAKELKNQPQVAAELMFMVGESFIKLGDTPAARRVLPDAAGRCEQAYGRLHVMTVKARCLQIEALNDSGEIDASERLLAPLIAELRAAMPTSAEGLVRALRSRSFTSTKHGAEREALADLREAWALGREHLGLGHDETLMTAGLLGNTLNSFHRTEEANQVLEQAVAIAREAHGASRPHVLLASIEGFQADVLSGLGRYREAATALRLVLRDQLLLDGMDTDRNRFTKTTLARTLTDAGALEEAIVLMHESIEADARLVPKPTVDKSVMHLLLGWMLNEAGQPEAALAEMERAEVINAEAGGKDVPLARLRRTHRANACLAAGRVDEALAIVIDMLGDGIALIPGARVTCLRVRVGALRVLGRLTEAEAEVAALFDATQAEGILPIQRARAHIEAATLRLAQRRPAEAASSASTALDLLRQVQYPTSPLIQRAQSLLDRCDEDAASRLAT